MSALDDILKKHRKKIIDREDSTFRQLLSAYEDIENDLKKSFQSLESEMQQAQENGEENLPSWLFREQRLKKLLEQVREQILRFGGKAANIIENEQRNAIKIAIEQAQENYKFLIGSATDKSIFRPHLDTRSVETAVGLLGDGSPLIEYFEQTLAPAVTEKIKSEIIKASALGTDFRTVANNLRATGEITKYRAFSVARTEVNRVRRETTREIFKENDDLIEEWEWVASKSVRTCPLCLAMDGKRFPLSEPFPQHINCRCTMISILKGLKERPRTIGKDWFESQDDATKESILGKEAFIAYQDNNIDLDDFVAFKNDKRFGKSVTRKPLAKILADKGLPSKSNKEEINLPENITVEFGRGTKGDLKSLIGKKLSENEIGALVGALSNSKVKIIRDPETEGNLFFEIEHPAIFAQQRTLGKDYANRLYFHNDYFETNNNAPKGIGLKSFATQALISKKFGVEYIHTFAAGYFGHPSFNGYYTWARMGYNAELTDRDKSKLPKKYENLKDLHELMEAGGKDDWKKYGEGRDMLFDLSDDSKSIEILQKYLRERNFVVKF